MTFYNWVSLVKVRLPSKSEIGLFTLTFNHSGDANDILQLGVFSQITSPELI